ncbi:MAG TPA: methylated-DNA--[protein]-cysteine S-methyltransferase [Xanthobacteraceae bacterium]|jgi:methylated-DNA-[protein]-cysteine S-methyltransferase|nr:methylated-DNA--[protein]-cysteine S-methyltransferase [Xanthobacteraceae bacterium]
MSDTAFGFAFFDTAIGRCSIVWNERGVVRTRLPERSEQATRERIRNRYPAAGETAPPAEVEQAIHDMIALLGGEPKDLSDVKLDISDIPEFNCRVYDVARTIPPGATLTYGEIAERLGDRALARDVGQALGENPFPIIVPCHRVLAAGGKTGGFSAPGGVSTKMRMLTIEQARGGATTRTDQLSLFEQLPLAAQNRSPRRSQV